MPPPTLIIKPPQGQKTVEALRVCEAALRAGAGIVVFVTGNSIAQGDQVSARARACLGIDPVLLHGGARRNDRVGAARLVVCICNATRLRIVAQGLDEVFAASGKATIFVDEADKTLQVVESVLGARLQHPLVDLYLITATSRRLFERFQCMRVHVNSVGLDSYMRMRSMTCEVVAPDPGDDALLGDVRAMARAACPLPPGAFLFVPADHYTLSHESVATALACEFHVNVLVINGRGYTTFAAGSAAPTYHPKRAAPCSTRACGSTGCRTCFPTEFDVIQRFKAASGAVPLALTGNACIGRAITCHTAAAAFTHGLLSARVAGRSQAKSQRARDDLYQICSRLAGSFAGQAQPPRILTTSTDLLDVIREGEAHAFALAERLAGRLVTADDADAVDEGLLSAPTTVAFEADHRDAVEEIVAAHGAGAPSDKLDRMAGALFCRVRACPPAKHVRVACIFDDTSIDAPVARLLEEHGRALAADDKWLWGHRADDHVVAVADMRGGGRGFVIVSGRRAYSGTFDMWELAQALPVLA